MKKTTVYLRDEEADALKQAAAASGRSQSELIREGVRRVTRARRPKRVFYSMGIAEGPGLPIGQMAEEILEREWAQDLDADR
jgi:Arc/MetJ-type ribon-helix-helix transcriptional regulator